MKAKIKKKILFTVLICAGVISIGIITVHFSNQHLSKSELAQLRKQYPIYGPTISQELIDAFGKEAYIEQYHEKTENFIYGEIVGEHTTFWRNQYTGKEAEKSCGNNWKELMEYTMIVSDDTNGIFEQGDEITLVSGIGSGLVAGLPVLAEGMKVVIPVYQDSFKESRYWWSEVGMYYVTEDGYVISAFDEETLSYKVYSGIKVEELLEKVKVYLK